MRVNFRGQEFRVWAEHDKAARTSRVELTLPQGEKIFASAKCSPRDEFSGVQGRAVALGRALKRHLEWPQDQRKAFLQAVRTQELAQTRRPA